MPWSPFLLGGTTSTSTIAPRALSAARSRLAAVRTCSLVSMSLSNTMTHCRPRSGMRSKAGSSPRSLLQPQTPLEGDGAERGADERVGLQRRLREEQRGPAIQDLGADHRVDVD